MNVTDLASGGDGRVCPEGCGFVVDKDYEGFLAGGHEVFCPFPTFKISDEFTEGINDNIS